MHSSAITDPQDPSDSDDFSLSGNAIYASYAPWLGGEAGGAASASAAAGAASGSPGSVVAVAAGGITINLLFDAAAMAAPASFRAGIQQAAAILAATISDQITVNLTIHYTGTGGGAFAGPDWGQWESYSSIRADLINNATAGDATFNALPGGSSVQGQSNVAVWNAELKLWGLLGANDTTTDDGSATFATDINPNLLVGVALHELTHALGRIPYGPQPDIFDLFRFTSPAVLLFQGGATAPAAYFSVDGGYTKLADFGRNSDPSDFLNSGVQGPNDPFNEFYNGSTSQSLTAVDKAILDALGFHTAAPVVTSVIEALGSIQLAQVGNYYFLYGSGGSGPSLKYGGANIVVGQWGGWAPIGGEVTATGYEVAWKLAGADQYTVWNTDTNGNDTTNTIGTVSGSSSALESLETSFHQDLNGDGVIGVPTPVVIEAFGSTHLTQVGNNYSLYDGGGSGPSLKYGGVNIVVGQWGGWAPIGGEVTATGYEVAWKLAGADQYTVWNTDTNGNDTTNTIGTVSGSSSALESLETSFHQDLNGDGVIGVPGSVVIEAFGSTHLTQIGNNYFLYDGGGTGPSLKFGGANIVVDQWGGWAPIGAEVTATGYEVAWKLVGADQYTVWNTDTNGNDTTNTIGTVSGSSSALESLEASFHQDLNGDGVTGVPAATSGIPSSSLTQAAPVPVAQHDAFVFSPNLGAAAAANAGRADMMELDVFSWLAKNAELATFLNDPQTGQPHVQFQWANDWHDMAVDPASHDSAALKIADLYASAVFIR